MCAYVCACAHAQKIRRMESLDEDSKLYEQMIDK